MPDLSHLCGADLALGQTGDLATADGPALGTQRILRRLLTNPSAYLWHLDYGAGLAGYVGNPAAPAAIATVARSQLFLDAAVAADPAPVLDVTADQAGRVFLTIRYADAATAQTQTLAATIPGR